MKKFLWCASVLLLFPECNRAQTTITVVDGATSTSRYAVINEWLSANYHSLYHHIYKQPLLNQAGQITSIDFEHTANSSTNTNVKIYMGETTKSSFTSSTDWVNSGLTEVYSGTLTTASGWYTVTLGTPFTYTNTDNLILVVHMNGGTGPNGSAYKHIYDAADANVTLYNYSSSSLGTYGSWSGTGYTRQGILPSLKLTFSPNCVAPALDAKADAADAVTICSGASVQLTANPSGGSNCGGVWEYAWYTGTGAGSTYYDGSTWNNAEGDPNVYSNSYLTVSGVIPLSTTTYKVKAKCSTDASCNDVDATGVVVTVSSPAGPTFSNTDAEATGAWDGSLAKSILVCGLSTPLSSPGNVLQQVNIDLGDGTNSRALTEYAITLQSPIGTSIIIKSTAGSIASITRFNVKYRDHAVLSIPQDYGSTKEPYDIGYYRTSTAGDFSIFNGEDPNGTWTITITETSGSTGIAYNQADLIFGTAFTYNDISASTANDDCPEAACLETGTILIGTNNAYADPGPATDPPLTLDGCSWNGAKNNSAWFTFKALATTAQFTISGVSNSLQILAYTNSGTCAVPTYALLTGGCPNDAANDTYTSPQYANGCTCNMQLNMSSLTIGNIYYIIVDGNGGAISDFYIEFTGGDVCSTLPIGLLSFGGNCMENEIKLRWATAAEINNDYFSIERGSDGERFYEIEKVQGAGNASAVRSYEFVDREPPTATAYYRLKQVDYDGKYEYFGTISVKCRQNKWELLLQNMPAAEELFATLLTPEDAFLMLDIIDVQGRMVKQEQLEVQKGSNYLKIDLSQVAQSVYIVKIYNAENSIQKKFVKVSP